MTEKMKKGLQENLSSDEKILWESGTQAFALFSGKEGRMVLLRWVICAVGAAALAAAYATHGASRSGAFYIVLLLALAVIIGAPILTHRQLLAQRYYVTDRRAVILRPDGSIRAMERAAVDDCRLYSLDCGGVALAVGGELAPEGDKQLRWRAAHPIEASDYAVHGMVFYRPERADDALRILRGEG